MSTETQIAGAGANLSIHEGFESGSDLPLRAHPQAAHQIVEALVQTNGAVDTITAEWADRSKEVFRLNRNPDTFEVGVDSDVTLADYFNHMSPETRDQDFGLLMQEASKLRGKSMVRIGATHEGGGVAMMAPPQIHMFRQLGIDAHWYTMKPYLPAFDVTKAIHNGSQDMPGRDGKVPELTEAGKQTHGDWNDECFEVLKEQVPIQTADIIMIDDPQPAPMIRRLKELNPNAKIVFRNHIQTDRQKMATPGTIQNKIHNYLWYERGVSEADAYIAHPVETPNGKLKFAPVDVPEEILAPVPATSDEFDDQNEPQTDEEVAAGLAFVDEQLIASGQQPLSRNKPRAAELARLDPAKGMHLAVEMMGMVTEKMRAAGAKVDPELLLVGNGSKDDPDGTWMRAKLEKLRDEQYADKDIKIERLKHNYAAMNALLRRRQVDDGEELVPEFLIHLAEAEGWEDRVSVAIKKGVPAIVFNIGGPPYQVVEGRSGFVLDYNAPGHDLERGAAIIAFYMMNPELYAKLAETTMVEGKRFNAREFGTTANVTRLMMTFNNTLEGRPMQKEWKISELVSSSLGQAA